MAFAFATVSPCEGHPAPRGRLEADHDRKGWNCSRKIWRDERDTVFSCWYPKKEEEAGCRVPPKVQRPKLSRMLAHHTIKKIKEVIGKVIKPRVLDVMGREAPWELSFFLAFGRDRVWPSGSRRWPARYSFGVGHR